jgi:hypothetical protein
MVGEAVGSGLEVQDQDVGSARSGMVGGDEGEGMLGSEEGIQEPQEGEGEVEDVRVFSTMGFEMWS